MPVLITIEDFDRKVTGKNLAAGVGGDEKEPSRVQLIIFTGGGGLSHEFC